ncbi:MAG TPA: efflux RND transporter periplasmic adaptor subunit [Pirellulales bacterium]
MSRRLGLRIVVLSVLIAVCAAGAVVAVPRLMKQPPKSEPKESGPKTELVSGSRTVLRLPDQVAKIMDLQTAPIESATAPTPLQLDGWLILDPSRLVHVRTRFAGEVVEIGTIEGVSDDQSTSPRRCIRELRFGDEVNKGDLMAVVWSKELGEKKSELVDALSKLHLHQETAARLEELYRKGAIPERSVREAEQDVDADEITVSRVKRTLTTWRLTDADIAQIEEEAKKIRELNGKQDAAIRANWARVEIRAASKGVIVERNVAVGVNVDTQLDLFKVADLKRLEVMAHIYEEDLNLIENRPPEQRQWSIHVRSDPEAQSLAGRFDQIGPIIDSSQHTALVMGWVDNSVDRLRIGQFITATIELPAPKDAVTVPLMAVVDQGGKYRIFIKTDPYRPEYTSKEVTPLGHCPNDRVYLSTRAPTADGQPPGPEGYLKPGEIVVTSGALELASAMDELVGTNTSAQASK